MAIATVGGEMIIGREFLQSLNPTSIVIDGATEKAALMLRAPKTGTISQVAFRTQTVTTSNALKVSIQGWSLAYSPLPDGTIKGTGNSAYGTQSSVASTTWYTVTLGTALSVTAGDRLAIVVQYDSWTNGNLQIDLGMNGQLSTIFCQELSSGADAGGGWGANTQILSAYVIYDDGSTGFRGGSAGIYNASPISLNNSSTPRKCGFYFQLPFAAQVAGLYGTLGSFGGASGSTPHLYLYDASDNLLAEGTHTGTGLASTFLSSLYSITANTWYRLVLGNDHANTAFSCYFWDLPSVAAMNLHEGGENVMWTQGNTGSWTNTTTRKPMAGIILNGFDVGAAAGGRPEFRGGNL